MKVNEVQTEETMADYEEHFDDANPWNRVYNYSENKTVLHVKVEGIVNGGVIVMIEGLHEYALHQDFLYLILKIWKHFY